MLRPPHADVDAGPAPGREIAPTATRWRGTLLGFAWLPPIVASVSIVIDWLADRNGAAVCGLVGHEPVAFVDDDRHRIGRQQGGLPVRGPSSANPESPRDRAVRDGVVAMPRLPGERLLHVISTWEAPSRTIASSRIDWR
ncbi:MAG: hypothetical protein U0587_13525 [Candidatus Binatia bacterium]